jgi:hypothetical protein
MSKLISELLAAEEPLFTNAIRQLEKESGNPSADIRLGAEIMGKVQLKTKELGLDADDTTPEELYHALENRVRKDNERIIEELLKLPKDTTRIRDLVPPMVEIAQKSKIPKKCWALKRSVAKKLLRQMPPKQMMKTLGYRSIDSMLKNEPFDEMYTGLRFSEGADWLNEYNELFKTVKASDFEERDISIVVMDHDKWVDLADGFTKKKLHNVTHTKELGVIVVMPMKQEHMRGLPLKTMSLLFHYINEIRLYSAFFKLKSMKPNFGEVIIDTLVGKTTVAKAGGQHIHWQVIQQYLGRHKDKSHPEAFQPHVQPEDLHWRRAEDALYELDPELEFWLDLDFVARPIRTGVDPVALNLMDVAFAYSNEEPFAKRYVYHFRESLWNEVFIRYMGEGNLEEQILEQLDNDMIEPEDLTPGL